MADHRATATRPRRRRRLAELGANLALMDRRRERLEQTFGAEDERRLILAADLLDQAQVNAAVAQATARFGRIDVLCNIAGGFRMGEPVHATSAEDWGFLFDINARTLLHAVRAVVPRLIAAGGKSQRRGVRRAEGRRGDGRVCRVEECGDPADRNDGGGTARKEH
jgi:NAD(P)-dependent dehydrogenase (short-subunit alcohol dehydrogenase family)